MRIAVRAWMACAAVSAAYYVLRITVFAFPSTCPDTVWEPTDDPRCDWTWADLAWAISVPVLALAAALLLVAAAVLRLGGRNR